MGGKLLPPAIQVYGKWLTFDQRDLQVKKRKEALAAYVHQRERIVMASSQTSNLEEKSGHGYKTSF